jgi:hypothetical protein
MILYYITGFAWFYFWSIDGQNCSNNRCINNSIIIDNKCKDKIEISDILNSEIDDTKLKIN